ncbi:RNA polymerase subunit sigma [Roseovarius sp. A46]|uniref:sigma-70 family RNA polymerase sigma factor n=1 Tax=Roseovarius sp. A46 TaxID=2109331 RepID=UPI001011F8FC|nr:sigma-70 family RNA polymerase sigma factor [Roseovarius sp. A46]RXV66103.1 RNA polymerase subunit sigma [Roseovarius sp. A46]
MNKPYFPNRPPQRARAAGRAFLSPEEETRLARAWRERGDVAARNRLVTAFTPLVQAMVARFTKGRAQDDPDLMQQAYIGLMRAADGFDPDRGIRFATYAAWWVRAELQDYRLLNWSLVRRGRSAKARQAFYRLGQIENNLPRRPGEDPAEREARLAAALGVDTRVLGQMRRQFGQADASLHGPVGEDGAEAMDLLPDPDTDVEADVADRHDRARLRAVMVDHFGALPERERHIVVSNVLADPPLTLQELGDIHGVSRERIRQLRDRGLERLRAMLGDDATMHDTI